MVIEWKMVHLHLRRGPALESGVGLVLVKLVVLQTLVGPASVRSMGWVGGRCFICRSVGAHGSWRSPIRGGLFTET